MAALRLLHSSSFFALSSSSTAFTTLRSISSRQATAFWVYAAAFAIPAIQLRLPSLPSIWESILRAVPKKKTSHRKKRQRFLAGKALKDATDITKCPSCAAPKKAHLLCPYCVKEIKEMWRKGEGTTARGGSSGTTVLEKE